MNLDRVTITGADDSVPPSALAVLSESYPFVEWGILISESRPRGPRFPSYRWVQELVRINREQTVPMKLSLHVCGRWTRQWLLGIVEPSLTEYLFDDFQRVQLNFHAERTPCRTDGFAKALRQYSEREFIFQIDGATGNAHLEAAHAMEVSNCVSLFDISGGAGVLPESWPKPLYINPQPDDDLVDHYAYHGYAGGLGPDNLADQIRKIGEAAGNCRIWIDMETRVRSPDDMLLDLEKVRQCLDIGHTFISK